MLTMKLRGIEGNISAIHVRQIFGAHFREKKHIADLELLYIY